MKLLVVALLSVVGLALGRPDGKYTHKYDNVDLDEILKSDRLTQNYVDCLLDKKPCTADGEELKRTIPDALKTDCTKCTEKQKDGARTVIRHLYKNKKNWWNQLEAKYDPGQVYTKKHAAELKAL